MAILAMDGVYEALFLWVWELSWHWGMRVGHMPVAAAIQPAASVLRLCSHIGIYFHVPVTNLCVRKPI